MSKRRKLIHARVPVLPPAVYRGMYLAAWATAEACPIYLNDRRPELYARHNPSDELDAAWSASSAEVIGCIGWAIPTMRSTETGRAHFAAWPPSFGVVGQLGKS